MHENYDPFCFHGSIRVMSSDSGMEEVTLRLSAFAPSATMVLRLLDLALNNR